MTFEDKLIRLMIEETKGKTIQSGLPDGKTAEVVQAMAAQLGGFIALSCGGDAAVMSQFLEGASSYMFECAADKQKAGAFIADKSNWYVRGDDGQMRKGGK
jgi:hypothetical protein